MKKLLGIALLLCIVLTVLAGCGQRSEPQQAQTPPPAMSEPPAASEPATGVLKTGMAIVTTRSAVDAGEDNGTSQVDSLAVGVIVDENGRIVDCSIDMAWNTMQFTPEGAVVMRSELPSKRELGDDYGMRANSGIDREWYQQADALEEYVIGKTAEEVAGIEVDEETRATEPDLTSSVTIRLSDYKTAIVEAVNNAQEMGTQPGDTVGLGVYTHMNFSGDASAERDGVCEADSAFALLTLDGDGKITAALFDATQGAVSFDTAGKVTSDLTGAVPTKRELGDNYGMEAASSIGMEWYEQADALAQHIIGKNADELTGLAIGEDGKSTDVDLLSSATISIDVLQKAALNAIKNAG